MKQKETTIIGAGLAGLAAGYTLTKAGRKVTIIEQESYPGGRVRSLPINEYMVDFGGFIIYPWYTQYHKLIKELGLKKQLKNIPLSTVYYELERNKYTADKDLSFPIKDMAKLYIKTLPKMIRYKMDIAKPALGIFENKSISEYIKDTLETNTTTMYETFSDIVCQGYCYGPVTQYKMAVVAPVVLNTTFRGDLKDSVYFYGNNGLFAEALANYITNNGGEIKYKENVISLEKNKVTTNSNNYTSSSIICAAQINKNLLKNIAPNISVNCPYTKFYNAVIKCDKIPQTDKKEKWGAVFYLPDESMPLQILSSVNVREMLDGKTDGLYVNLNIIDRTNKETLTKAQLTEAIKENTIEIFPNITKAEVIELVHWKNTMPIAEESFIESIREIQGKNNIWFAGDYLGSPSMETAIQTGVIAAKEIIKN